MVKRLPAMQEIWVPSLGREDGRKGNGNPLQYYFKEKSHEWRSLVDFSHKQMNTPERFHFLSRKNKYSANHFFREGYSNPTYCYVVTVG